MTTFQEEQTQNLDKLRDLEKKYGSGLYRTSLIIWENKAAIIQNWVSNADAFDDDGQPIDWQSIGNETFDDFWDTEPVIELDLGNGIPHYYHTSDYEEIYKLL